MAATFAVVGEYFGTAAAADGAVAVGGEVAATEVGGAAAAGAAGGAAGGAAVGAGAGTMAAAAASDAGGGAAVGAGAGAGAGAAGTAAAAGAAGGTLGGSLGTSLATAAAGQVVGSLLAPKAPKAPGVTQPLTMPDPQAQQAATRKSLVEQMARRGRASTILTDTGSGKLGG